MTNESDLREGNGPPPIAMPTVGIRELAGNVSGVVAEVARTGRPVLLTKHGKPVAALVPVTPDCADSLPLARAPGRGAELSATAPTEATRTVEAVLAELEGLVAALREVAAASADGGPASPARMGDGVRNESVTAIAPQLPVSPALTITAARASIAGLS